MCRIVDVTGERPNGFISYDNIIAAIFSIFQSASEQGWTQTMYITMDSDFGFAAAYHVLVIVFINFILMSLFVAVIADTFSQVRSEAQDRWEDRKRYNRGSAFINGVA
jgi:large-conductance mechanosensitive channel